MAICPEALKLICDFEGYLKPLRDGTDRVVPYFCPAGVATVGFGSIWRADGTRVQMSDPPITRAEAMHLMGLELTKKCEPAVDRLIAVKMHELMRGSLVSWTYNLGEGALRGSNLRRVINARQWSQVPAEFAKWRMASGRVLPGLVRRRKAEADMFMAGVRAMSSSVAENDNDAWVTTIARAVAA